MPTPIGTTNIILQQWQVSPPGIENVEAVKFDLTRRAKIESAALDPNGQSIPGSVQDDPFPSEPELANDDAQDDDETDPKANTRSMFSVDGPGITRATPPPPNPPLEAAWYYRGDFEEFVRVRFDRSKPLGNSLQGSQASFKFKWMAEVSVVLNLNTGRYERTPTGNYIGPTP